MTEINNSFSPTSNSGENAALTSLTPTRCDHCGQAYYMPQGVTKANCPACAVGKLQPDDNTPVLLPIEFTLPAELSSNALSEIFNRLVKGVWLAPDDFKPTHLNSRCKKVFWPMWMVDCRVSGQWQAEMGFDYQVKSSKEHYSGSSWQTQELLENRIRWEPRLGTLDRPYHNQTVPALTQHELQLKRLGRYDLSKAIQVQPDQLADALIEKADLTTGQVWNQAQSGINAAAADECRQASEAQHVRNFELSAKYNDKSWSQLLLPMFATWYQDDKGNAQVVLVNAQTGKIFGKRMASQKKGARIAGITFLLALGLLLLGLLTSLLSRYADAFLIVSVLLFLLGGLIAIGALVPLIWPWQWNMRQKG